MFQVRTIQLSLLHISVMLHLHYVTHASLLNQSLNTSNVGGRRITGTLTRHLVVTTNLTYPIQYQTQKTNIGLELISPYNAESTKTPLSLIPLSFARWAGFFLLILEL
jgi:hypothetical protein